MNLQISKRAHVRPRKAHAGVLAACRSALLYSTIAFLFLSCAEDVPRVDMGDVVNGDDTSVADDGRSTLRIAVAAMTSPETTRDLYKDLLQLIANGVGRRAVFAQRRTYAEVNDMVMKKEVALAFVCSGPYTNGHDDFGMELLVVPAIHGKKTYHSYIIVHKDADLTSFPDLRGRRFAFTDPDSNTGCLVPTYMLARQGETPKSFFAETFYTHSHDNSIRAVADGLADGAAVDSLIWEFMNTVDPTHTSKTRIIEKSPPFGIPPIVVHPELNEALKKQLREVFLSLHNDGKAAEVLGRLQIDRFEEGDDAMYDTVREMRRWIEKRKVADQ